jgi:membrane protease YdiL (CAAX protease family)
MLGESAPEQHDSDMPAAQPKRPGVLVPKELSVASAWMDVALAGVAMLTMYYVLEPMIPDDPDNPRVDASLFLARRALSTLATVGLAFFLLRSRSLPARTIGVTTNDLDSQIMAAARALALAYVATTVCVGLIMVLRLLWPHAESLAPARRLSAPIRAAENADVAIALMATTAIMEETLFRGILLTRLRRALGSWWSAVLISSVCFGAIHLEGASIVRPVFAFFLSLAFSLVFIRSGSLLSVVLAHFLFNCLQLLVVSRAAGL